MGCCWSKRANQQSERTLLLSASQSARTDNTDEILTEIITLSTNLECSDQKPTKSSPPVQIYKASDSHNIRIIPSINDTHIHNQIHVSIFINHWFGDSALIIRIPSSIIHLISNFVLKQNISSIVYIDTHCDNDLYLNVNKEKHRIQIIDNDHEKCFVFDDILNKNDTNNTKFKEIQYLCNDFICGYNTALISFGNKSISKHLFYHKMGFLYLCIDHILNNLINCCLFIQIYGIFVNEKEEYIDLLKSAKKVTIDNEFENKMLLNIDSFDHLMAVFTYNLNEFEAKNNNDIIIIFELSLQSIINDNELQLNGMNTNNVLNETELRISKMQIVDIGNVNAIHLIGNTPSSNLFKSLSKKVRFKHQGLLNMETVIKYIAKHNNDISSYDRDEVDRMCSESLLTHKLRDAFGGNCRTIMFGTCSDDEKEKTNTMTTLKLAETAMNIYNHPCINLFYPKSII